MKDGHSGVILWPIQKLESLCRSMVIEILAEADMGRHHQYKIVGPYQGRLAFGSRGVETASKSPL